MRLTIIYPTLAYIFLMASSVSSQENLLRGIAEGIGRTIVDDALNNPPGQTVQQSAPKKSTISPGLTTQPRIEQSQYVGEIQSRLNAMGYDAGPVDGVMGRRTAAAITQYQIANGLSPTGRPSPELASQLRIASGASGAPRTANPSFDCAKAGTIVEHAICDSSELAELDRMLADAYRQALATSATPAQVKSTQRSWLAQRNACGAENSCLDRIMRGRIASLSGSPPVLDSGAGGAQTNAVIASDGGGVVLESADAYGALLQRYIQDQPELSNARSFLLNFAGLGCKAQGWARQNLNPFDRQEILSAAQSRLDAIADRPSDENPLTLGFSYRLTVNDYDMETRRFPFSGGGSIEDNLVPQDLCRELARDENAHVSNSFPLRFMPGMPDGSPLNATDLAELLGGAIEVDSERARAFYDRGFPNVTIKLLGLAGTPRPSNQGVSHVPITPIRVEVRALGADAAEPALAVFNAEDFDIPTDAKDADHSAAADRAPPLRPINLIEIFFSQNPSVLTDPKVASIYAYSILDRPNDLATAGRERCLPVARLRDNAYTEFDIQRLLQNAPEEAKKRLQARSIPKRFVWQSEGTLGTYDTERGVFPVERAVPRRGDHPEFAFLNVVSQVAPMADCLSQRVDFRTPNARARDDGALNIVPMDAEAAEQFVSAVPDRTVTVTLYLQSADAQRTERGENVVTFEIERAVIASKATGRTLREIDAKQLAEVSQKASPHWAEVPELSADVLFLQSVRRDLRSASDEDNINRWIQYANCRQLYETRENPIRRAKLLRDLSGALADAAATPSAGPHYFRLGWVTLGDYDLETETFPLQGHSLDGGKPLGGLTMYCSDNLESDAPDAYTLAVEALPEIAAQGLPLSIDAADAYIEARGGRRQQWERIRFDLIVDNFRFGQIAADGTQAVDADAIGYRIMDLSETEVLHEAVFDQPEKQAVSDDAANVNAEATRSVDGDHAKDSDLPETDRLSVLGLSLESTLPEARASLTERYGANAVSQPEPTALVVEQGPCRNAPISDPSIVEETGSTCVIVQADDQDAVQKIIVRNVVEGQHAKAYRGRLAQRFGEPVLSESTSDAEMVLGWGEELSASAEDLDRPASTASVQHTLEARLSEANGITLVTIRIDADMPTALSEHDSVNDSNNDDAPPDIDF